MASKIPLQLQVAEGVRLDVKGISGPPTGPGEFGRFLNGGVRPLFDILGREGQIVETDEGNPVFRLFHNGISYTYVTAKDTVGKDDRGEITVYPGSVLVFAASGKDEVVGVIFRCLPAPLPSDVGEPTVRAYVRFASSVLGQVAGHGATLLGDITKITGGALRASSPFLALMAIFGGVSLPLGVLLGVLGFGGGKLLKEQVSPELKASGEEMIERAKAEREQLWACRHLSSSLVGLSNSVGIATIQKNVFMSYGKSVGQKYITFGMPSSSDYSLFCSGQVDKESLLAIQSFTKRAGRKAYVHSPATGSVVLFDRGQQISFSGHKIPPCTDYRFISVMPNPPRGVPAEDIVQADTLEEIFGPVPEQ